MKTAMQEAIELVKKYNSRKISYNVLLGNLELLLEKEKEQIIDAYENGVGDENERNLSGKFTNAEQYYNKTYNQNK
jgi:hypothetical protein